MSFWIHAYCHGSVATVTPDELKDGIAKRLALLTWLFCPPNEEDPDDVLDRLRIEDLSSDGSLRQFKLHSRNQTPGFIRGDRTDDRGSVQQGVDELESNVLQNREGPALETVRTSSPDWSHSPSTIPSCRKPTVPGQG